VGGVGTELVVSFHVSRPLPEPPTVDLDLGGQPTPLESKAEDARELRYAFSYLATGAEPEGSHGLRVTLVDEAGTETVDERASLTLDFTPPALVTHAVAPTIAGLGASLTVHLQPDEALGLPPALQCSAGTSPLDLGEPFQQDTAWTWFHTVGVEDEDGTYSCLVEIVDLAGNRQAVPLDDVRIDTVKPALVAEAVRTSADRPLRDGDLLTLVLEVTEELAGPPHVLLGDGPLDAAPEVVGLRYSFSQAVAGDPGDDAVLPLLVELTDTAGNRSRSSLGEVVLDFTPPTLVVSLSPEVAGTDTPVSVAVVAPEPLSPATVLLELRALPDGPWTPVPVSAAHTTLYEATLEPAELGLQEGAYELRASAEDLAGHAVTFVAPRRLLVDADAPRVVVPADDPLSPDHPSVLPDRTFRDGEVLEVSFLVSEPLAHPPGLRLGSVLLGDPTAVEDRRYTYRVEVTTPALPEGSFPLMVELVDLVGNRVTDTTSLGSVTLDFTSPSCVASLAPEAAGAADDAVEMTIDVSEPLVEGSPQLDLRALPDGAWVPFGAGAPSGRRWVFRREVGGAGLADGTYGLRVRLEDLAGNTLQEDLPLELVLDTEPPRIVFDAADPDHPANPRIVPDRPCRDGDSLAIGFGVSEPLPAPPRVWLGGEDLGPPADYDAEALRYTYAYAVSGQPGEDARLGLTAELVDRAGNRTVDGRALGQVVLDYTPPDCAVDAVPPVVDAGTATLRLAVHATEPLAPGFPTAELRHLPDGPWEPLPPPEQEGPVSVFVVAADGLADGTHVARVGLRDLAGNARPEGEPDVEVRVDRHPPEVLPGAGPGDPAAPRILPGSLLRHGQLLSVSFRVSEPLAEPPRVLLGQRDLGPPTGVDEPTRGFTYGWEVEGGPGDDGRLALVAELVDLAGNQARWHLGDVVLDFTAPALAGVPLFVRCDGRASAREAPNDLWLGALDCAPGAPAVTVDFQLSEPTAPDAWPEVEVDGRPADLDLEASQPPGFLAVYSPTGDEPEAPEGVEVVAAVRDAAGNEARLVLGVLRFDRTPPRGGDEAALVGMTLVRDPWGSDGGGYQPGTRVRLAVDVLEEPAQVRVWDAEGAARRLIGEGWYVPGETLAIGLGAEDRVRAYVTATDRAGNESDASRSTEGVQGWPVLSAEWIATLHGKVVDDLLANPHALHVGVPLTAEAPLALDVDLHAVEDQGRDLGPPAAGRQPAGPPGSGAGLRRPAGGVGAVRRLRLVHPRGVRGL